MHWDGISGNWKEYKGKIREKWSRLTDEDVDGIEGKRDRLESKLQSAYGRSREEVCRDIDDFCFGSRPII